ncbi:SDR family NAD(P)-dependent oxidoreductase [Streptomyces sp. NPDC005859]|uniref:SDR family NAD(P)-dependent oxidoreductase n=1 Tax=Streptomyces sp. NPDC005859 TaxID=3157170 RepID=UPI0034079BFF
MGIVRVTEAALPLLRKSANPTVVTVSSSDGSFWTVTNPDRPEFNLLLALYSASKSAATMLTVQYAKSQPGIKFNAGEPGTTATDLTAAFESAGRRRRVPGSSCVSRLSTRTVRQERSRTKTGKCPGSRVGAVGGQLRRTARRPCPAARSTSPRRCFRDGVIRHKISRRPTDPCDPTPNCQAAHCNSL